MYYTKVSIAATLRPYPTIATGDWHETVLLPRGLLALAAHRGAGSWHRPSAREDRYPDQDHRRRGRLLGHQPQGLRPSARTRQWRSPHRGPGHRPVPGRPEARGPACTPERKLGPLPAAEALNYITSEIHESYSPLFNA